MTGSASVAGAPTPGGAASSLDDWRQGDFSLDLNEIILVDGVGEDGLPSVVMDRVIGVALVSQTCDVVNVGPGKEHAVVCPLVAIRPEQVRDVARGSTPVYALLETPPAADVVVDLGRMMTVTKGLLTRLGRNPGFATDAARVRFAAALERKHGRFAFPDAFNDLVLTRLRDRANSAHDRDSDNGRAYRAIRFARAAAVPSWDREPATVTFFFIVEPGADLAAVSKVLDAHFKKLDWPKGFEQADPPYELLELDQMTAAQWHGSQEIDWAFISVAKPAVKAA